MTSTARVSKQLPYFHKVVALEQFLSAMSLAPRSTSRNTQSYWTICPSARYRLSFIRASQQPDPLGCNADIPSSEELVISGILQSS